MRRGPAGPRSDAARCALRDPCVVIFVIESVDPPSVFDHSVVQKSNCTLNFTNRGCSTAVGRIQRAPFDAGS